MRFAINPLPLCRCKIIHPIDYVKMKRYGHIPSSQSTVCRPEDGLYRSLMTGTVALFVWTEVLNATYLDSYRILVQFNNGVRKIVDFANIVKRYGVRKIVDFANIVKRYPVFQPLSNLTLFKQFKVTDTL